MEKKKVQYTNVISGVSLCEIWGIPVCMIHVVGLDGWRQIPSNPGINSTRPSSAQWAGSVVGIATGYGLNDPGIESRWGRDFPHLSKPALGPNQPPVQRVPGLSRG
jgi:hypothetical protein